MAKRDHTPGSLAFLGRCSGRSITGFNDTRFVCSVKVSLLRCECFQSDRNETRKGNLCYVRGLSGQLEVVE